MYRLPEAHGGRGGNHNVTVSLPMATCVRAHTSRFSAALPGRPCALPHGPAVQRGHGPLQTGAASRGDTHSLKHVHMHEPARIPPHLKTHSHPLSQRIHLA